MSECSRQPCFERLEVSAQDVRQTLLPPLLETAQRIEADLARAYNQR